jgi:hypothetical protein
MSDSPSAGRNAASAPVAPSRAARLRPATQRSQQRRRALVIGYSIVVVLAFGVVAMKAIERPIAARPSEASSVAGPGSDSDLRTARITNDAGERGCSRQIFDNQTGRMVRSQQPCETTTLDNNGVPVPVGTIHRLDAISKSFSSH